MNGWGCSLHWFFEQPGWDCRCPSPATWSATPTRSTLAILRWGIGLPVPCCRPRSCCGHDGRQRGDWLAVVALGLCFFGLFFVLYNIAVSYTTAARASLALSTLPLQTMLVGAVLGIEKLTARKSIGVGVAVLGVAAALASGLSAAPPDAWRGELIMTGAVLCMAFYNVWSRPFMRRSSALGFLAVGWASARWRCSPWRR